MVFKNRVSQYPNRRILKKAGTNEIFATVDVERAEGAVDEHGTALNAETLNAWAAEINNTYVRKDAWLNTVYPIGSIYVSVNSTSPQSLFGGTWTQLKDRFLLGAGTTYSAGTTGGSAALQSHTHTVSKSISASQSSHYHSLRSTDSYSTNANGLLRDNNFTGFVAGVATDGGYAGYRYYNKNYYDYVSRESPSISVSSSISVNSTGSGNGQNMPPYLTVYMWKRTA